MGRPYLFDAIKAQFGLSEKEVIHLMRGNEAFFLSYVA